MHDDADELDKTSLHVNQEHLRAFNAQQKLKAAVYALIGLNRLQYNGELPVLAEEGESEEEPVEDSKEETEEEPKEPEHPVDETKEEEEEEEEEKPPAEEADEEEEPPTAEPIEEYPLVEEAEREEEPPAAEPADEKPVVEEAEKKEEPPAAEPTEKEEPQQSSPSSIPADTPATSNCVVTRDVYAAFTVAECHAEPVSKEYFALAQKSGDFFADVLKDMHGDNFESLDVTLRKSLYNAGQPNDDYNIYVEWDITAKFTSSDKLPTRRELCGSLVKADLEKYLLDYVRPLEETAFALVTNVYFGHFAC